MGALFPLSHPVHAHIPSAPPPRHPGVFSRDPAPTNSRCLTQATPGNPARPNGSQLPPPLLPLTSLPSNLSPSFTHFAQLTRSPSPCPLTPENVHYLSKSLAPWSPVPMPLAWRALRLPPLLSRLLRLLPTSRPIPLVPRSLASLPPSPSPSCPVPSQPQPSSPARQKIRQSYLSPARTPSGGSGWREIAPPFTPTRFAPPPARPQPRPTPATSPLVLEGPAVLNPSPGGEGQSLPRTRSGGEGSSGHRPSDYAKVSSGTHLQPRPIPATPGAAPAARRPKLTMTHDPLARRQQPHAQSLKLDCYGRLLHRHPRRAGTQSQGHRP